MPLLIDVLILAGVLQIKHFLVDFTSLQTPWMYQNKGNPKHPGGYAHAGAHVLGTLFTLQLVQYMNPVWAPLMRTFEFGNVLIQLIAVEFVWHWLTDLVKTDVVKVKKWNAYKHAQFWTALGLDQLSHQLCYLVMIAIVFKPFLT